MPKEKPPKVQPYLFTPENPKPGDPGYIEPGFKLRKDGYLEDEKGNIYDANYNLIKEAPSPGLILARKQHPDWSDEELAPLAIIYNKQLRAAAMKNEEKKSKKKTKRK
jgi:hypothetical protein